VQFRNLKSLPDLIDQNILGVFMNESDANTASIKYSFCETNIDNRRPEKSIEVYFQTEEEEYKERLKEQEEFDKIFR
jgi:hypothetical protein